MPPLAPITPHHPARLHPTLGGVKSCVDGCTCVCHGPPNSIPSPAPLLLECHPVAVSLSLRGCAGGPWGGGAHITRPPLARVQFN